MKAHQPTERPISRFAAIVNGYADHINGYDDGEWPASERPAGYYSSQPFISGDPEIDSAGEPEIAAALSGTATY